MGSLLEPLKIQVKVMLDGFKNEMNILRSNATKAVQDVTKDFDKLSRVGDTMKNVGSTLTKAITLPLAGVGIASAKMAIDFDSSFAKVSTLLDKNIVNFDEYKKGIITASNESGIAVGEFSESVYQSISAGVDQTKAIEFTTQAMELAKGGFTTGSQAVDILTTAINGYNLKAEDSTRISDLLITTQNLGKTTVDELSSSMGKVIPIASSSNFSIEELSTSYAVLTKNGISTAESGTYMRSMLSELTKSGSVADKALRELSGKGFAQLKKEGVPTTEILKKLDDHAKKNGKSLKDMFGSVEAGSAAMVLAKEGGAEYNEILKEMENSSGATSEAAKKMEDTLGFKLKKAINELKNSFIELGDKFAPVILKLVEGITNLAKWFGDLDESGKKNVLTFGLIAMSIGPVLSGAGTLVSLFANLSIVAGALGVSVGALLVPFAAVVAGAVALFIAVSTNFAGIRDTIVQIMTTIKDFINMVVNVIKMAWQNDFLMIRTITEGVWNHIKLVFQTVFTAISDIFKIFSAAFKGDWSGCWEAVKQLASNLWENIKLLFSNFLNTIVTTLKGIAGQLLNAAKFAFEKIKEGFSYVWTNIKNWFNMAKEDPVKAIKSLFGPLLSAAKGAFNKIKEGFSNVWNTIKGWFNNAKNDIVNSLKSTFGPLFSAAQGAFNKVKEGFSNVWGQIKSWINSVKNDPVEAIKSVGSSLFNAGANIFRSLWVTKLLQ